MASLVCASCILIFARTYLVERAVDTVDYVPLFKFTMAGLYQTSYPLAVATIDSAAGWGIRINGTEVLGTGSGVFELPLNVAATFGTSMQNCVMAVEAKGNLTVHDFHIASRCQGCSSEAKSSVV